MTTAQPDALPARVVRFRDLAPRPWRNGGGLTRDIAACSDRHGLAWRVSVADVDVSGDFSAFPGLERILMLCLGTSMRVTVDGTEHVLHPWDMIRFSGDAATHAAVLDGPTVDLNVMTRRESARADVALTAINGTMTLQAPESGTTLFVAVEGDLRCCGTGVDETWLRRFDTLYLTADNYPVDVVGAGQAVRVHVDVLP
jgi:environmental stress-induced protein Ves